MGIADKNIVKIQVIGFRGLNGNATSWTQNRVKT